jgi:CubicO group peptidase (beta-lactamase class C family)
MKCSIAILTALLLTAVPAQAQSTDTHIRHIESSIAGAVRAKGAPATGPSLAERMKTLNVPGVSIAFFRNGRIEWARGFGVTKIGGPPVAPETLFQAGSISKPVAATAALQLAQLGKLDLDADVNGTLKSWKVPQNKFTATSKVTLRGLLTHTAGLTVHGFPGYASGQPVPTAIQVLDGTKPANTAPIRVDTVPGTKWRYSGGGYTVMQQLLADRTGQSFPDLLRRMVLMPAGMTRSTYEQPLPAQRRKEAATPYDDFAAAIPGGAHTYPEMAAAGLWTTPSDLAHYAIAIQNAYAGKPNSILSQAMAQQMLKRGGKGDYGLGPALGGSDRQPWFGHGGVDEGFVASLTAYYKGDGVVIMTNGANGGRLGHEILRTIAQEYDWPDFQPKEVQTVAVAPGLLDRYAGSYRAGPYTVTHITRSGDALFAQDSNGSKSRLLPLGEAKWVRADTGTEMTFASVTQGKAARILIPREGGASERARIDDTQARRVESELAARIKARQPQPGAAAALRHIIETMQQGKPDYGLLSPGLAKVVRAQLPGLQSSLKGLGAIRSVRFDRVQPNGQDVYNVAFAGAEGSWRILLDQNGKILNLSF